MKVIFGAEGAAKIFVLQTIFMWGKLPFARFIPVIESGKILRVNLRVTAEQTESESESESEKF